MKEYLIEQLKAHTYIKGKQKTWISELSDEQIYELYLRLRNEESAKSIARHIQKAWSVKRNSTIHSLSQGILKFKKRIVHLLLPPIQINGRLNYDTDDDFVVDSDSLEGIDRLFQMQKERIEKMMQEEKESGLRVTNMSREIQALTALTKSLMKAKEFELLHGGHDPVKQRKLERMKYKFTNVMNTMLSGDNTGLLDGIKRFLELVEDNAVTLEVDSEGKYKVS